MGKLRDLSLGTLARLRQREKPDPGVWVFSSAGNVMCNYNSRYLFEYVLAHCPEITPLYVINDEEKRRALEQKYGREHLAETATPAGMRRVLGAGVWFTSAGLPVYAPGTGKDRIIVNLWHGVPLKQIVLRDPNQNPLSRWYFRKIFSDNYTWILTTTSALVPVMAESFGVEPERIRVWGQPRDDVMLERGANWFSRFQQVGRGILKALGRGRQVLYAPTFRDGEGTRLFPFPDFDPEKLRAFLTERDCTLWLRLHSMETAKAEAFLGDRIRLLGDREAEDATALLPGFDALITDYSSIYIDYLLVDRPVIFLPYDRETYLAERGFNFSYDEVTPGPKPETMAGFLEELDRALDGGKDWQGERDRVRDFFHEVRTPCCRRICREVEKRIGEVFG